MSTSNRPGLELLKECIRELEEGPRPPRLNLDDRIPATPGRRRRLRTWQETKREILGQCG
jgi:hypothetical protein